MLITVRRNRFTKYVLVTFGWNSFPSYVTAHHSLWWLWFWQYWSGKKTS